MVFDISMVVESTWFLSQKKIKWSTRRRCSHNCQLGSMVKHQARFKILLHPRRYYTESATQNRFDGCRSAGRFLFLVWITNHCAQQHCFILLARTRILSYACVFATFRFYHAPTLQFVHFTMWVGCRRPTLHATSIHSKVVQFVCLSVWWIKGTLSVRERPLTYSCCHTSTHKHTQYEGPSSVLEATIV